MLEVWEIHHDPAKPRYADGKGYGFGTGRGKGCGDGFGHSDGDGDGNGESLRWRNPYGDPHNLGDGNSRDWERLR